MSDSYPDLEAELRCLPLAGPSAGLLGRLDRALAVMPTQDAACPRKTRWLLWPALGLAAALAIVATVGLMRSRLAVTPAAKPGPTGLAATPTRSPVNTAAPAVDHYEPVGATNMLYELRDEGPATLADGQSGRRLRYRYVDTYTWENPRTNGSLTWSVPRDEIRVIPASLPRYFHRSEQLVALAP